MMAKTLHLVIPGLLGPWPASQTAQIAYAPPRRAVSPVGLPIVEDADAFIAALTRLADNGDMSDQVHFRPDLHGVLLANARVLALEPAEIEPAPARCWTIGKILREASGDSMAKSPLPYQLVFSLLMLNTFFASFSTSTRFQFT
jgi:hypothetical protein